MLKINLIVKFKDKNLYYSKPGGSFYHVNNGWMCDMEIFCLFLNTKMIIKWTQEKNDVFVDVNPNLGFLKIYGYSKVECKILHVGHKSPPASHFHRIHTYIQYSVPIFINYHAFCLAWFFLCCLQSQNIKKSEAFRFAWWCIIFVWLATIIAFLNSIKTLSVPENYLRVHDVQVFKNVILQSL